MHLNEQLVLRKQGANTQVVGLQMLHKHTFLNLYVRMNKVINELSMPSTNKNFPNSIPSNVYG